MVFYCTGFIETNQQGVNTSKNFMDFAIYSPARGKYKRRMHPWPEIGLRKGLVMGMINPQFAVGTW